MSANHKTAVEYSLSPHYMANEDNLAQAYIELREQCYRVLKASHDREQMQELSRLSRMLGDK